MSHKLHLFSTTFQSQITNFIFLQQLSFILKYYYEPYTKSPFPLHFGAIFTIGEAAWSTWAKWDDEEKEEEEKDRR